jgi:Uma2 family endonuclease
VQVEIEQKIVSFPMDDKLQASVQALVAEGWELNPSAPAVAVYHLVRKKPVEQEGAFTGKLIINDDLISVVKAAPQP